MTTPAFVRQPKHGVVEAVVGTILQVWVIGRVRKFERACKVCGARVTINQMSWRPSSVIAPNRADRVCLTCWPLGAEKVEADERGASQGEVSGVRGDLQPGEAIGDDLAT